MKKILQLIQGSGKSGSWTLIGTGFLGIFLSIWSHFSVWRIVDGTRKWTGAEESGMLTLLIIGLIVVGLLFVLRSVYAIIPVIFYFIYVFEQLFGIGIFRLIMNASAHKLRPGLYVMLPLSAICLLIGAIGCVIYRVTKDKN